MAAFEMAESHAVGLTVEDGDTGWFFGEDQARYLLAVSPDRAQDLLKEAKAQNIPARSVGRFGGDALTLGDAKAPMNDLKALFHDSFETAIS